MSKVIDGYELFFNFFDEISHEKMIQFGLSNLMTTPKNIASTEWSNIKDKLINNQELFIRGYGRDAKGTELYLHLYSELFNNSSIKKDSTNNHNPTKHIQSWTKHSKSPTKAQLNDGFNKIQNFQISHVFGKTKNPLLFIAPWNIIVLPKIMDPFTGHEAKGELKDKFTMALRNHILNQYSDLINDYNNFTSDELRSNIQRIIAEMKNNPTFSEQNLDKFEIDALNEWETIR